MKDFDNLQKLAAHTVRLLLYIRKLDVKEFYEVCDESKLSPDEVISTRCGTMQSAIGYLLNFKNPKYHYLQKVIDGNFNINKAYTCELFGKNKDNEYSLTSHGYVLLYHVNSWFIVDSYIGCREFTVRNVRLDDIKFMIRQLNSRFNEDIWYELTGCENNDSTTVRTQVVVYEYDYNFDTVNSQFIKLLRHCHVKLMDGDNSHMNLISHNNDVGTALNYLNVLTFLAQSDN